MGNRFRLLINLLGTNLPTVEATEEEKKAKSALYETQIRPIRIPDQYVNDPFFQALQEENKTNNATSATRTLQRILSRFNHAPVIGRVALHDFFAHNPHSPVYDAYRHSKLLTLDTDTPLENVYGFETPLIKLQNQLLLFMSKIGHSIGLAAVHPDLNERTALLRRVLKHARAIETELNEVLPQEKVLRLRSKIMLHTLDVFKGESMEYPWIRPLKGLLTSYLDLITPKTITPLEPEPVVSPAPASRPETSEPNLSADMQTSTPNEPFIPNNGPKPRPLWSSARRQLKYTSKTLAKLASQIPDPLKPEYDALWMRQAQNMRDLARASAFRKRAHLRNMRNRIAVFFNQVRAFEAKLTAASASTESISVITAAPDYKPDIMSHPLPGIRGRTPQASIIDKLNEQNAPDQSGNPDGSPKKAEDADNGGIHGQTFPLKLSDTFRKILQEQYLGNLDLMAADMTLKPAELLALLNSRHEFLLSPQAFQDISTSLYLNPFALLTLACREQTSVSENSGRLAIQILKLGLETILEDRGISLNQAKKHGLALEVNWGNRVTEEKIGCDSIQKIYLDSDPDFSSLTALAVEIHDLMLRRHEERLARFLAEFMDQKYGSRINWNQKVLTLKKESWEAFGAIPKTGSFWLSPSANFYYYAEGSFNGQIRLVLEKKRGTYRSIEFQRHPDGTVHLIHASKAKEAFRLLCMLRDAGLLLSPDLGEIPDQPLAHLKNPTESAPIWVSKELSLGSLQDLNRVAPEDLSLLMDRLDPERKLKNVYFYGTNSGFILPNGSFNGDLLLGGNAPEGDMIPILVLSRQTPKPVLLDGRGNKYSHLADRLLELELVKASARYELKSCKNLAHLTRLRPDLLKRLIQETDPERRAKSYFLFSGGVMTKNALFGKFNKPFQFAIRSPENKRLACIELIEKKGELFIINHWGKNNIMLKSALHDSGMVQLAPNVVHSSTRCSKKTIQKVSHIRRQKKSNSGNLSARNRRQKITRSCRAKTLSRPALLR